MNLSLAATSDAIGVLVVDSNRMQAQLLTSALRRYAEFRLATCSMDADALLQALAATPTSVVLLSPNSFVGNAENMAAVRQFHLSYPKVSKVLLVESCDREMVVGAFRSGFRGIFCLSESSVRLLGKCIQRVAGGQIWANTEQLSYLLDLVSEVPSLRVFNSYGDQLLTPREEQVVALVSEGLANREVAVELQLSEHTIKKYLFRIFDKLGISTRVELVLYAVNHGDPRHVELLMGMGRSHPRVRQPPGANGPPLKTPGQGLYNCRDDSPCPTPIPTRILQLSLAAGRYLPLACCCLPWLWS